jgi:hypothetical protein
VGGTLKIDTNGDAQADIAVHILFAPAQDGRQTATVYRATGASAEESGAVGDVIIPQAPVSSGAAAQITMAGGYTLFAGLRSDPFFVDPAGFFNNFQWTGHDVNVDKNVFGMVLELLNHALRTSARLPYAAVVHSAGPSLSSGESSGISIAAATSGGIGASSSRANRTCVA